MGSCLTNLRELSTAVTNQSGSAQIAVRCSAKLSNILFKSAYIIVAADGLAII